LPLSDALSSPLAADTPPDAITIIRHASYASRCLLIFITLRFLSPLRAAEYFRAAASFRCHID
jgi:hypothetical protein